MPGKLENRIKPSLEALYIAVVLSIRGDSDSSNVSILVEFQYRVVQKRG